MSTETSHGEEFIAHYGVLGMRWGVRRRDRNFNRSKKAMEKALSLEERSVAPGTGKIKRNWLQRRAREQRIESVYRGNLVTREVMSKTNRAAKSELAGLRKRPEYKNINYRDEKGHPQFDFKKFDALQKEESQIWVKHLNQSVEGQQAFDVKVSKSGKTWELIPKRVKHAASDEVIKLKIIRDEDGFIVDIQLADEEDSMEQSEQFVDDFLAHYGVLGMRWGVRKDRGLSTNVQTDTGLVRRQTKVNVKGGESHPAHDDAIKAAVQKQKLKKSGPAALSNNELRELSTRLQLEAQVNMLTSKKGKKFAQRQLETAGQQQVQRGIAKGIATGAAKKGGKAALLFA